MRFPATLRVLLTRFRRDRSGVAMVEFAATLPLMLILFALFIESARMLWAHQMVVSGVRDAARYVARVTPRNICPGGSVSPDSATLKAMVEQNIANAFIADSVTINGVSASAAEGAGTYRIDPVCVATVIANVTIDRPFGGIFAFGGNQMGSLTYDVADMARIHGE